jgi:hypothetical protein
MTIGSRSTRALEPQEVFLETERESREEAKQRKKEETRWNNIALVIKVQ